MGKLLKKEDFLKFLEKLKSRGDLIAPVKRDILRFEKVTDLKEICFDGLPVFPIKKFFLPPKDEIFSFKFNKIYYRKKFGERIIFGARLCDVNALDRLDKLFLNEYPDETYKERREKTTIICVACIKPVDEHCFCNSMKLENCFDLCIKEVEGNYYIDIGSEKGRKLVSKLNDYNFKIPKPKCKKELKKDIKDEHYESSVWQNATEDCLRCARCTNICPSCLCYDVMDETNLELKEGKRERTWDSCQLKGFTRVAGGFIFRDDRTARFRHRIFHKLKYFKDQFNKHMCVGCGRCIRHCPTGIDFVKIVNRLK